MQATPFHSLTVAVVTISVAVGASSVSRQAGPQPVSLDFGAPVQLTLHEPIVITATITNDSNQRLKIDLGKNYVGAFKLVLTRPDGSQRAVDPAVPRLPDEPSVRGTTVIEPFKRYSHAILLNEWLEFLQVGTYYLSIKFRGSIVPESGRVQGPPEASLRIDVLPFNERALRSRCEALLRELDEGRTSDDWAQPAKALAAVDHPVAVEYLGRAINANRQADYIAIDGLAKIGNEAARAVLEDETSNALSETARYARAALMRLQRQQR